MIKEAIGTADTIEEAISNACKELGVDVNSVSHEVIQQPEKKKFGLFGGCPAKVRVYFEVSPFDLAKNYIDDVLRKMGVTDFEIQVIENDDNAEFNLVGDDLGAIIGRHGETLNALQYLACLVANNSSEKYCRISINTNNYREKRESALISLGRKQAIAAAKRGKKISLEPMNPYERKLIHTAVQQIKGAISWSEGEKMNRHVVIGPDPDFKPAYKKGGYNNRSRNNKYSGKKKYNSSYNKKFKENDSSDSTNDNPDVPLYGKIIID